MVGCAKSVIRVQKIASKGFKMEKYRLTIDLELIATDGNFKKLYKLAATALKNGKGGVANITNAEKRCDFWLRCAPEKKGGSK